MQIIETIALLKAFVKEAQEKGHSIALVPTMGALHEGHASLVERAVKENDVTIVSIFLNPTQFNDPNDLKSYPRTLDADLHLLESLGATVAFTPSVAEIYPAPDTRTFSYPPIDTVMEGANRPGHFNGVCQIVSKLFEAATPNRAYFGEKDFQQIAVIRAMVADKGYPIEIVPCPIIREANGLAKSSRNVLLSEEEREEASLIYKTLKDSVIYSQQHSVQDTTTFVVDTLNAHPSFQVEYHQICDGRTLQPINSWDEAKDVVGCITVRVGKRPVRLIDHIRYR